MTGPEFDAYFSTTWLEGIQRSLACGLDGYNEQGCYPGEARRKHSHRSDCSIRHDLIIDHAKRILLEMPDVHLKVKSGKTMFVFGDRVLLSFNLLDKKHHTRGNRTRQSRYFLGQRQLVNELPHRLFHVVAGYRLDPSETTYELWLIAPDGAKSNAWERRLDNPPMASIFDLPYAPIPQEPTERVRIRHDEAGQERKHGTDESTG